MLGENVIQNTYWNMSKVAATSFNTIEVAIQSKYWIMCLVVTHLQSQTSAMLQEPKHYAENIESINGLPRTVRKALNSERRTARLPLGSTYLPGFMGNLRNTSGILTLTQSGGSEELYTPVPRHVHQNKLADVEAQNRTAWKDKKPLKQISKITA